MKIKKSLKNQRRGDSTHTRTQKKRVPVEVKIGRTFTIFDFLKYVLGARSPADLPDMESGLSPPNLHLKYLPGGHPHLPQTSIFRRGRAIGSSGPFELTPWQSGPRPRSLT